MWTHIDLCCGLGGWQAPFQDNPQWRSIGIDARPDLNPDIVADVRESPLRAIQPELVTASPPCTEFTKYRLPWYGDGCYDGPEPSMELVDACLNVIEDLDPSYWILENVVGLSKYWKPSIVNKGPFHFWGNFPPFDVEYAWKGQRFLPADRRGELAARIPYHYANGLRKSVEWYL